MDHQPGFWALAPKPGLPALRRLPPGSTLSLLSIASVSPTLASETLRVCLLSQVPVKQLFMLQDHRNNPIQDYFFTSEETEVPRSQGNRLKDIELKAEAKRPDVLTLRPVFSQAR